MSSEEIAPGPKAEGNGSDALSAETRLVSCWGVDWYGHGSRIERVSAAHDSGAGNAWGVRGSGLVAKNTPGHILAQLFACDDQRLVTIARGDFARGALDGWAVFRWHAPIRVEPRPDVPPVAEAACAR